MKKLAMGIGLLLFLAIVLPVAAVPVRLSMTSGGVKIICPNGNGEKCGISWNARIDNSGNVNGNAQLRADFPDITLHANIDQLLVCGNIAYVGGVVTFSPDEPTWLNKHICFKVMDGGKGGDDYISGWYEGNIGFCKQTPFPPFYLIVSGQANVA